jgi:hypothetical protein
MHVTNSEVQMTADPFAGFIQFSDRVWGGIDRGERSAQKFKYLIGIISRTLADTHSIVLQRLAAIEDAATPEDANRLLEGIRTEQLTEAFRVEGLCDTLGGLGEGLVNRSWHAVGEGTFSDAELADIRVFAERLHDRETEVASAYAEALSDVTRMNVSDQASLLDLKERIHLLDRALTDQVVDFRSKAKRFMSVSP